MTIYDALKKDHETVKALLERLVGSADADKETRNQLIAKIRDELVPHSRAEEAVFYNSLREIDETKDLVAHGYQEHMMAEGLLRTLQVAEKVDIGWQQTARKLQDALLHHIENEEGKIFAAAKRVLAPEEAEAFGEAFEQMKPEVHEEGIMQTTIDMITNMMPQRFVNGFKNLTTRS
ncbi:MAG: hemerythrin domain-containing protein [Bdellovibrionota bacterium]